MDSTQEKPLFLALTALEEFWDKTQPTLFLGPWCQSYDNLSSDNPNFMILEHPDLVDKKPQHAFHYTLQSYEKLLPQIANWLNQIHNTDYSLKYWRIAIGAFLLFYIQVVYHRWNALKIATSSYSDLYTIGLEKSSYLTPINSLEFGLLASESDAWNHQLMTQILDIMSFNIKDYQQHTWEKELKQRQQLFGEAPSYKKSTRIKIQLLKLFAKLRGNNLIGLYGEGGGLATKEDLRKVLLLSKFRILPLVNSKYIERAAIEQTSLDMSTRESLSNLVVENDFLRIVLETLKINFPINFIEHYKEEIQISNQCFPFSPRVILGGCIFDDRIAMWSAKLSEKGSTLVATQHGGAYGILNLTSYEQLEVTNSDTFISWGWKNKSKNVLPAPSVYICKRKEMGEQANYAKKRGEFILWLTTDIMRYTVHLTSISLSCHEYFKHQEQFLSNLEDKVLNQIIMRLRPTSKYQSYLKNRWGNLNIQCPTDKESFFEQLGTARIVICDNINTTFLYALAFNIPTILFWDKIAWEIREEAKPYFKALQRVGIYHDNPKSAASMLNSVFDSPDHWWNDNNLQSVRHVFCENYAKMSPNWLNDWVNMLLNLSKTNKVHDREKNSC